MNKTIVLTTLLAFAAAAPLSTAAPAPLQERTADPYAEVNTALDRLQQVASERGATRETYERWKNALIERARAGAQANPGTADYTRRFTALAEDLNTRITSGKVVEADFARAREITLEARIDWAVAELERMARARNVTRDHFQRALSLVRQRATAATQVNPDTPYRSAAIEKAVTDLSTRSPEQLTRREFAMLQETILRSRLESALSDLERQARARSASRASYERWRNVLTDWAAAAAPAWPQASEAKTEMLAEIDAIEKQQEAGKEVLSQFRNLRDRLGRTTREASATTTQPTAGRKVGGGN